MQKLRTHLGVSILGADFANMQAECQSFLAMGVDYLHIDIMDGHFVDNLSLGPPVVECFRKKLPKAYMDCHLMVTDPQKYLEPLSKSKIDSFGFHFQAKYSDLRTFLQKIKQKNINTCVSVKPSTPLPQILIDLAKQGLINQILIMTVEPGFGGQKFQESMTSKISHLRKQAPNVNIQVDGGLNEETTKIAASHGANSIVVGSAITSAKDRQDAVTRIKKSLNQNFLAL